MFWNTCYGQGANQLLLFPPCGLEAWHPAYGDCLPGDLQEPMDQEPSIPALGDKRGAARFRTGGSACGDGRKQLAWPLALGPWAPASAFPSQMVVPCPVLGILSPLLPIWDVNSQ